MPASFIRASIGPALLALLAAPAVSRAADPFVDEPPPPGAVCPAIAEDYEICRANPMSGNCGDFVTAARALGRLYLFNVQRQPERAEELKATVWWQCGSASFGELAALLGRIDSPEARAVLAEAPYRDLRSAAGAGGVAPAPGPGALALPECAGELSPASYEACERRALADAETRHRGEVERCESLLTPFLRDQLAASEAAWRRVRGLECPPGEGEARCLATATRERTEGIGRTYPECASGLAAPSPAAREGPLESGPRTGMLPARWTPPQGGSQAVPFSFESLGSDTTRGTMHATLGAGGERFSGEYLRIERSTQGQLVTAVSIGWSGPEWQLWKHDPDGSWTEEGVSVGEFAHFYTGKVVATLRGDRGDAMRCLFVLKDPEAGLLHGGTGRCQVTDGGSLTLEF